jgi:hypothetical protein
MANLWHYTTKERLEEIINSGELRATEANKTTSTEKATLWFSKNPIWEPTATKMVMTESGIKRLTKNEQYDLFGLGRIQINDNVQVKSWKHFKEFGGGKLKILRKLEEAGIKMGGNPSNWFWTFEKVGIEKWITVEFWDGNSWQLYKKI